MVRFCIKNISSFQNSSHHRNQKMLKYTKYTQNIHTSYTLYTHFIHFIHRLYTLYTKNTHLLKNFISNYPPTSSRDEGEGYVLVGLNILILYSKLHYFHQKQIKIIQFIQFINENLTFFINNTPQLNKHLNKYQIIIYNI